MPRPLGSFTSEPDLQQRAAIHADELRLRFPLPCNLRNIQTIASSALYGSCEAVPLSGFKGKLREAVPEVHCLELKACKAIAAYMIEAALRLTTIDEGGRPAARTVECERHRFNHAQELTV